MNRIDLRRADLNLLVVFQVLHAERHVGRAAQRLAVTQSAASHALRRLRELFGDPLFVRHPKGVEPTARALELAPAIADILNRSQSLLASAPFDSNIPNTFSIATIDLTVPTIIVPLMEHLRRVAPAIDLRIVPLVREQVVAAFDRQEIDMALLNFPDPPARITRIPVLRDRYVGIARRGHPGLKGKRITAAAYAGLPHLLFSPRGDATGFIDEPLAQISGRRRRVAMTIPHVLAVPSIISRTDLVTVIAERIARLYMRELGLVVFEPPIKLPEFTINMLTSAARAGDSALQWLQKQVMHVCASDSQSNR